MGTENAELLKAIYDVAVDVIITIDDSGIIQSCNRFSEKMFGYSPDELIGQNVKVLMPSPFREEHDQYIQNYIETGLKKIIGIGRRVSAIKKDGTQFPVSIAITEATVGGKSVFVGIIRDITVISEVEERLVLRSRELERSNKELEQFAYVASHDLQEPLRMIGSFTELLSRRYKDRLDEDANEFISFIVDGAKRLRVLVGDLLKLSRVGSREVEISDVDLNELLDEALTDASLSIEETKAVITRDKMPTVPADRRQLGQLLLNLISNSLKFKSTEPPQIHIGTQRKGKEWIFSIADNGIGIDPQYFDRIFLIFQRLHVKEEYQGTGIGLAICKKIVERHQGKIWIESQLGKGATFYFSLPTKHKEESKNASKEWKSN